MVDSSNPEQKEKMTDPAASETQHSFNNKWDLASKHELQPTQSALQASHVILDTLRLRRGSETAKWLNTLEDQITPSYSANTSSQSGLNSSTAANIQARPDEILLNEKVMIDTAIRGLDKIFDEFELYALEFNRNAKGTDLMVTCTRPIKNMDNNDKCISYAGHLSTRLWAMVVRGCTTRVEVFVIPSELLLAFSIHSMNETGYQPLLVVESEWHGSNPVWHIEKNIITLEQVPILAKELFGDLIRVASGQMSEKELFAHPKQQFDLGKNLAVGYQNPASLVNPSPNTNNVQSTNNLPEAVSSAINLASLSAADQLLSLITKDINQLLEAGKVALQSDDSVNFEKIKTLTQQMDALRTVLTSSLENIHKANQ